MKKEIICTVCPRGCHILAEGEGETVVSVSGYGCTNGLRYASAEFAHPMRVLTSSVRIAGRDDTLLPVRSAGPVPKEKLFACMDVIRKAEATPPVRRYDVIIPDICGTGVDIVAVQPLDGGR